MRKLLVVTALLLIAGIAFGQILKKGAVLAIRQSTELVLKPDVTMNQYLNVIMTKWAPEMEKLFPDTKLIFMKGDRGIMANDYVWIWYFESNEVRNKYFTSEGVMKDEALNEKMSATMLILSEYVIDPGMENYTDWIVL